MLAQSDIHVTSAVLWRSVLIAAPIDIVFVSLLARRITAARLRQLKWLTVGTMAVFFATLWAVVVSSLFWESVYHYFFPAWSRWLLPLVYGLVFGAAGLVSWSLALRLRGNAVVTFCVLVGLSGMAGHVWAVHRGLMEKPPMLQGAAPEAAVVLSIFEFVFYAGVILTVADLLSLVWRQLQLLVRSRRARPSR